MTTVILMPSHHTESTLSGRMYRHVSSTGYKLQRESRVIIDESPAFGQDDNVWWNGRLACSFENPSVSPLVRGDKCILPPSQELVPYLIGEGIKGELLSTNYDQTPFG